VKKVISEDEFKSKMDEILKYINPYLESECVTYRITNKYFIIDVQSPGYFEEFGFDRSDGLRIKSKLKSYGFQSVGVGQYVKELNN
jgi:hypothetical protein